MSQAIIHWDTAVGHTDAEGNPVIWVVQATTSKLFVDWIRVAVTWDVVVFPPHPNDLDWNGDPTDIRWHTIPLTWEWKLNVCRSGQVIVVEDWPNATLQATQNKLLSN